MINYSCSEWFTRWTQGIKQNKTRTGISENGKYFFILHRLCRLLKDPRIRGQSVFLFQPLDQGCIFLMVWLLRCTAYVIVKFELYISLLEITTSVTITYEKITKLTFLLWVFSCFCANAYSSAKKKPYIVFQSLVRKRTLFHLLMENPAPVWESHMS